MSRDELTADEARALLSYDPETGEFTWLQTLSNRNPAGRRAGCASGSYWEIGIRGVNYRAHRLAWLVTFGEWPCGWLDHIDGDGQNNRIANLRVASPQQNAWNTAGHSDGKAQAKGVLFHPEDRRIKKWQARIYLAGRQKSLGYYLTKEDAAQAYANAAAQHFGEYARTS